MKHAWNFQDLTGQPFGDLTITRYAGKDKRNAVKWKCLCICGATPTALARNLKSGATRSCGCGEQRNRIQPRKHGQAFAGRPSNTYSMFCNAKQRAKRDNLTFDLELSDILIPDTCPVLGIPLIKGVKKCGPNSPSLDKRIPSLGYVKGNITVISHKANTIKQNATAKELYQVAAWLEAELAA